MSLAAGALAGLLLALATRAGDARVLHPLHTSLAQVTHDAARRELTISLRVFADDFTAAAAQEARATLVPGSPASAAAMTRYVVARLAITDGATRRPVPLAGCGVRPAGEVLFVCLRGPLAAAPSGATMRNAVLMERFADQVNIVQTTAADGSGGGRRTTLFTRGSETKRLP